MIGVQPRIQDLHVQKLHSDLFINFFPFILEKGEGRERKRERNIDVREKLVLVASHAYLSWELDLHPRHVPDLT